VIKSTLALIVVLSLLFSLSLDYLWIMLNALQLIVYAGCLFSLHTPSNVVNCLKQWFKIVSYDFNQISLPQSDSSPFIIQFDEKAGLTGSDFAQNLGSLSILGLAVLALIILRATLYSTTGYCIFTRRVEASGVVRLHKYLAH